MGLPPDEQMQGKSLVPLLTGKTDPDYHKPHVISEYFDAVDLPDAFHGTMYFDGRYKSVVYHGKHLGELYDLATDPGEFDNIWDDPNSADLKNKILLKHFDAMMATTSAGIERTGSY